MLFLETAKIKKINRKRMAYNLNITPADIRNLHNNLKIVDENNAKIIEELQKQRVTQKNKFLSALLVAVCNEFDVSIERVQSASRSNKEVLARSLFAKLSKDFNIDDSLVINMIKRERTTYYSVIEMFDVYYNQVESFKEKYHFFKDSF